MWGLLLVYKEESRREGEKSKEGIIDRSRFWNDTCDWISDPGEAVSQNGDTESSKTRRKQMLMDGRILYILYWKRKKGSKKAMPDAYMFSNNLDGSSCEKVGLELIRVLKNDTSMEG